MCKLWLAMKPGRRETKTKKKRLTRTRIAQKQQATKQQCATVLFVDAAWCARNYPICDDSEQCRPQNCWSAQTQSRCNPHISSLHSVEVQLPSSSPQKPCNRPMGAVCVDAWMACARTSTVYGTCKLANIQQIQKSMEPPQPHTDTGTP